MERIIYLHRYRVLLQESGAPVELRRDGSAVTYKAEDIVSGEEMAVQVVRELSLRPSVREKLEGDARAAEQLSHINIPALREFGFEGDRFIYAWEHFDGSTAEAWVTKHGAMPADPVLRIALQIGSALDAAAFHALVHHALNPRNVILVPGQTPEGDWPLVKILNFVGLAPAFTKAHAEAAFASQFASPEQLQRGIVDFRSEVYSLGATLWFLLTGAAPEAGRAVPRASGLRKPAAQLLMQMLAPDPDARPQDPLVFQERIRDCLEQAERRESIGYAVGLTVPAEIMTPVMAREERTRRPWKAAVVAALALLIVALVTIMAAVTLSPGGWLASFTKRKPIGVPIGVADTPAPAIVAQPSPEMSAHVSEPAVISVATPTATPEQPAIVAANPDVPEPSATVVNDQAQPEQSPLPETQTPAALAEAEPTNEKPPEPAQRETTPAEIAKADEEPPAVAAQATTPSSEPVPAVQQTPEVAFEAAPAPAKEETEPILRAQPAGSPNDQRVPTAADVAKAPPRQINGMEVRAAEPVADEDINVIASPPRPHPRPHSRRARLIGVASDGSLIFEPASSERAYVPPRR